MPRVYCHHLSLVLVSNTHHYNEFKYFGYFNVMMPFSIYPFMFLIQNVYVYFRVQCREITPWETEQDYYTKGWCG